MKLQPLEKYIFPKLIPFDNLMWKRMKCFVSIIRQTNISKQAMTWTKGSFEPIMSILRIQQFNGSWNCYQLFQNNKKISFHNLNLWSLILHSKDIFKNLSFLSKIIIQYQLYRQRIYDNRKKVKTFTLLYFVSVFL